MITDRQAQRHGFIGLGTMGTPMAANLARGDLVLTVNDVRPEPGAELAALGALVVSSPADVAAHADIVHINVVDDRQVREVMLGEHGILRTAEPGGVVVIHSTIHPTTCRELAHTAAVSDVAVLDAPYSGGLTAAAAGTLSFMVGGSAAALALVRPALDLMGTAVFHVGDTGMGEVAKLVNNTTLTTVLQGTSEGLRLAARAGIDPDAMLAILCASAGDSWVTRNWHAIQKVAADYPGGPAGLGNLVHKDLTLAMSVAHGLGAAMPLTAVTSQFTAQPYDPIIPDEGSDPLT